MLTPYVTTSCSLEPSRGISTRCTASYSILFLPYQIFLDVYHVTRLPPRYECKVMISGFHGSGIFDITGRLIYMYTPLFDFVPTI